ncbi:MAG TPA: LD-carboxypeptidase [Flavisolibacter sp.]|jgi:muramoyltetrapeptide carboxypeptidase|nr:LD-carboxypeptidase [Flavisolibacter sp.]
MNRKHFLNTTSLLLAGISASWAKSPHKDTVPDEELVFRQPPFLKAGDVIGITSPAGYTPAESILPASQLMQSWGFQIKVGNAIGKQDHSFGGTDEERLSDLQQMLDDPDIKTIMCARGGYGAIRLVDRLDWKAFRRKPKWLIGFSDITVLHAHIHRNCQIATLHSKMTNSFPDIWTQAEPIQVETINSIREALSGKKMTYEAPAAEGNRPGSAEGILIGGNLKTLETLAGSPSDIDTRNKILFVEDTGEYLYSIDRMFWNLKRSGKLDQLKGLIVGGFKIKPDDPGSEFGRSLSEIVLEKTAALKIPVAFDFPVGHQKNNFALKCGVRHRLTVLDSGSRLVET